MRGGEGFLTISGEGTVKVRRGGLGLGLVTALGREDELCLFCAHSQVTLLDQKTSLNVNIFLKQFRRYIFRRVHISVECVNAFHSM